MTLSDISNIRLRNQRVDGEKFHRAKDIVQWLGAMQAQDFLMSKLAVGIRCESLTEQKVEEAIDRGEIIRTHVMRPTWHLVSSEDVYWMLDLTSDKIKASMKSRNKELELTPEVFMKSHSVIEKALISDENLSREELGKILTGAGIRIDDNRLSHLLMEAELDKIICSGAIRKNRPTFTLLEKKVPVKKTLTREESLAELAERYFTGHGPAQLKDFIWWSGLSVTEGKQGLESVKPNLVSLQIGSETYWTKHVPDDITSNNPFHLLPAFDEFLVGYTDRKATFQKMTGNKVVSKNGIFYPVILENGQVIGLWKRIVKKDKVEIELAFFQKTSVSLNKNFIRCTEEYGRYMNKKSQVTLSADEV
jgi:hypothetical protein